MPEDRLVDALFEDERVRRLIVAEPYRSVAASRACVKRQKGPFPATPDPCTRRVAFGGDPRPEPRVAR